jgi:hypothetical protein
VAGNPPTTLAPSLTNNPPITANPPTTGGPPAITNPPTSGNPPTAINPPTGGNPPTSNNPPVSINPPTAIDPPNTGNPPSAGALSWLAPTSADLSVSGDSPPLESPNYAATPELDSLTLMGSGLAGLGAYALIWRRARKRKGARSDR